MSSSRALRFSMTFRSRMRASKSFCERDVVLASIQLLDEKIGCVYLLEFN
jgi:hypothetical protein